MRAKFVSEAIKHLPERSEEEIKFLMTKEDKRIEREANKIYNEIDLNKIKHIKLEADLDLYVEKIFDKLKIPWEFDVFYKVRQKIAHYHINNY